MLIRINPLGQTYHLFKENDKQTRAVWNKKIIILDMPLDDISKCWYNWQMKGMYLQDAFPTLSPDQREFLLTGITPDEWNEIFKEDEN